MNSKANPGPAIATVAGGAGKAALIMLMHPVWSVLFQSNLAVSPRVPWAAVVMLILLWLLWQFLDGRLGPKASAAARRALLKWRKLPQTVWMWALIAGGLAMIGMAMIDTHSFQLGVAAATNAALAGDFAHLPLGTGITFMFVTSLLAAFVEESAFRGYMQSDLARNFGMPATCAMVAVTFAVFHLYGRTLQQWWNGFPDWVVISVVFSMLVWLTGSILPALVCHFTIDLALFSLDWFDDPLRPLRSIVPGVHLSVGAILCCLSAAASVMAFRKLAKITSGRLGTLSA